MSYVRTAKHRELRAKLIHHWKPWEKSTGPRSTEGKAKISQNSYRGSPRTTMNEANLLERFIAEDARVLA